MNLKHQEQDIKHQGSGKRAPRTDISSRISVSVSKFKTPTFRRNVETFEEKPRKKREHPREERKTLIFRKTKEQL